MSTLQFSLFFAAILIAYLLVHLRLVRFESKLSRLDELEGNRDRLQRLHDVVARVDLHRIEELLGEGVGGSVQAAGDQLRGDFDSLRGEFTALRGELVQLRQTLREGFAEMGSVSSGPAAPSNGDATPRVPVDATAGERILAVVETRLLALGYRELRVLGDLSDLSLDETYEIRVECLRDGMPFKGTVMVRNAGVADVDLRTAAPMFP